MKVRLLCAMIAGMVISNANGATISLSSAPNCGNNGTLTIPEGGSGTMYVMLHTAPNDTLNVAFVNAFLDVAFPPGEDDNLEVTSVFHDQSANGFTYLDSYTLPAQLSQNPGNEYSLNMGDQDGPGFPLGDNCWILDTLTITNLEGQSGTKEVTFELGARAPAAYSPFPYVQFVTAPPGFPAGFENFLYVGDDNSTNPAFVITKVPEPVTFALLAMGGLAAVRRRHG